MKWLTIILVALMLPFAAKAENTYYLGPRLGSTSTTQPNGASDRDGHFTYGAEGYWLWNQFIAGLKFSAFNGGSAGTQVVNVSQSDRWVSAEGKYKFIDDQFSPYIGLGLGALIESVNTTIMGSSESASGTWFVPDIGIGLWGRLSSKVGLNLSLKYFQYSNVNGWDYSLSVGISPEDL
jgi:hypothetical protein